MLEVKVIEEENDYDIRSRLEVWHDGKIIAEHYDGGEPEDNYFMRDWNWVSFLIERVYELGLIDGKI